MGALESEDVLGPKYVLVVDDEPLIRAMLADQLRDLGLHVVEAASADEALAYIQANRQIDLVFTDIHMPGSMNGLELAATLQAGDPHLPVIVTSGNAGPHGAAGLGTFIAKPYRLADAAALVLRTLGVPPRGEDR